MSYYNQFLQMQAHVGQTRLPIGPVKRLGRHRLSKRAIVTTHFDGRNHLQTPTRLFRALAVPTGTLDAYGNAFPGSPNQGGSTTVPFGAEVDMFETRQGTAYEGTFPVRGSFTRLTWRAPDGSVHPGWTFTERLAELYGPFPTASTGQGMKRYRCDLPGGCSVYAIAGGSPVGNPIPRGFMVDALGAYDVNGFIPIRHPATGANVFVLVTQLTSVTSPPPAGQVPAGQVPAGQAPAGQAPAGKAPASQVPAGQIPAGQAPPTQSPQQRATTCAAPSGFCTLHVSRGRRRQLPNGTPLQVLRLAKRGERTFAFVRTAPDASTRAAGWIDASELTPGATSTPPATGTGQTYTTVPGGPLRRPRLPGNVLPASVAPATMRARCKFASCPVATPDRRRLLAYLAPGFVVQASATAPDGTWHPRNREKPEEGGLAYVTFPGGVGPNGVRFSGGEGWMDPNALDFEIG